MKGAKKETWKGLKSFFFNCSAPSPTQVALTSVFPVLLVSETCRNQTIVSSRSSLIKILIGLNFSSTTSLLFCCYQLDAIRLSFTRNIFFSVNDAELLNLDELLNLITDSTDVHFMSDVAEHSSDSTVVLLNASLINRFRKRESRYPRPVALFTCESIRTDQTLSC